MKNSKNEKVEIKLKEKKWNKYYYIIGGFTIIYVLLLTMLIDDMSDFKFYLLAIIFGYFAVIFFPVFFLILEYYSSIKFKYFYTQQSIIIEKFNKLYKEINFFDIRDISLTESNNISLLLNDDTYEILDNIQEVNDIYKQLLEFCNIDINNKDVSKKMKNDTDKLEYKRKCKVCGKIWCYTADDIKENEYYKKQVAFDSLSGLGTILSNGSRYRFNETIKDMHYNQDKIKDFDRCPECGSSEFVEFNDIKDISNENNQSNSIEEIKKLKELLDIQAITQEEFDKKKKELLNL